MNLVPKDQSGLTPQEQQTVSEWREKSDQRRLNYKQKLTSQDGSISNYYAPLKREGVDHRTLSDLAEADHYRLSGICSTQTTRTLITETAKSIMTVKDGQEMEELQKSYEEALQLVESLLLEMGPKDAFEAMLCLRMISLHFMGMHALSIANCTNSTDRKNQCTSRANKLFRTWNEAKDRLDKHRRKEDQKVVVEHVHIGEGGHALVGSFNHYPGGDQKK